MENKEPERLYPMEIKIDKSKAKFSIGVYGLSHLLKEKFEGDQARDIARAEELNQAFELFPGQQFGADFRFHLNDNLFASAGISWRRSISQFNKIIEIKDTTFIRTDEFAGQELIVDATRTIVHHNKLTSLILPLSLGYQTQFGKWGFGTNAGIAIHFTQHFSGRTLNSNSLLVSYPNNENDLAPAKDIYLSYQLNPFVTYGLNSILSIQLKTEIGLHQFGKTALYDLKHHGWSTGIGLGLLYTP